MQRTAAPDVVLFLVSTFAVGAVWVTAATQRGVATLPTHPVRPRGSCARSTGRRRGEGRGRQRAERPAPQAPPVPVD